MSDLYEFYQRRASVRKFKPEPLREGDLDKLLLAAQRAPTDATAQMYSLLRISDPVLRREISSYSGQNPHIETCAEFFRILADGYRLRKLVELRGGTFGRWPRTALH
ncbi:MAG: nitroreductase family protein, partial [Meiothermus sp.]|nr:nitroreductase family protein [Meiothermus sp.]